MPKNIVLKLNDDLSQNTIMFQPTPLQIHLITRVLGLDFDTSTGKVEYFDDMSIENILANDTFLRNIEKKRPKDDIHTPAKEKKKWKKDKK